MGPALLVPIDAIFTAGIWGFILALPISIFMAFWLSAVRSRGVVMLGALIGALVGFLIILGWVGTLIYDTPLPGAESNGVAIFFGAVLLCATLGLVGGICFDLIVASLRREDYRRPALHE